MGTHRGQLGGPWVLWGPIGQSRAHMGQSGDPYRAVKAHGAVLGPSPTGPTASSRPPQPHREGLPPPTHPLSPHSPLWGDVENGGWISLPLWSAYGAAMGRLWGRRALWGGPRPGSPQRMARPRRLPALRALSQSAPACLRAPRHRHAHGRLPRPRPLGRDVTPHLSAPARMGGAELCAGAVCWVAPSPHI